jgi:hypothetical protein
VITAAMLATVDFSKPLNLPHEDRLQASPGIVHTDLSFL